MHPTSRRTFMTGSLIFGAAALVPRITPVAAANSAISGEFVGALAQDAGDDIFVAVVADPANQAGGTRAVRAYVCNGSDLYEWLVGESANNTFELTADSGASITGELDADGVVGSFTRADGTAYAFAASPSEGIGGLYQILIPENGHGFGASTKGLAMSYIVEGDHLTVIILRPDGTGTIYESDSVPGTAPDLYRHIVLNGPKFQAKGATRLVANIQDGTSNTRNGTVNVIDIDLERGHDFMGEEIEL